jgi:hypothetical protein
MSEDDLVSRAGLEPDSTLARTQPIDSTNRQKRSNRSSRRRRFEVHGGYADYEFVSRRQAQK